MRTPQNDRYGPKHISFCLVQVHRDYFILYKPTSLMIIAVI